MGSFHLGDTWRALDHPTENPSLGSCVSHMLNLLLVAPLTCLKHSSPEEKEAHKVFDAIKENDVTELYAGNPMH